MYQLLNKYNLLLETTHEDENGSIFSTIHVVIRII
jgi:hypothetical protein